MHGNQYRAVFFARIDPVKFACRYDSYKNSLCGNNIFKKNRISYNSTVILVASVWALKVQNYHYNIEFSILVMLVYMIIGNVIDVSRSSHSILSY